MLLTNYASHTENDVHISQIVPSLVLEWHLLSLVFAQDRLHSDKSSLSTMKYSC